MNNTESLLLYLIQRRKLVSVTELMKLSYLIDYILVNKEKPQLTSFEYERYYYGPFDKSIYKLLEKMMGENHLIEHQEFSDTGRDYVVYKLAKEEQEYVNYLENVPPEQVEIVENVVKELSSCNAKILTRIAYETEPIKRIGAKIGNKNGLGVKINLHI